MQHSHTYQGNYLIRDKDYMVPYLSGEMGNLAQYNTNYNVDIDDGYFTNARNNIFALNSFTPSYDEFSTRGLPLGQPAKPSSKLWKIHSGNWSIASGFLYNEGPGSIEFYQPYPDVSKLGYWEGDHDVDIYIQFNISVSNNTIADIDSTVFNIASGGWYYNNDAMTYSIDEWGNRADVGANGAFYIIAASDYATLYGNHVSISDTTHSMGNTICFNVSQGILKINDISYYDFYNAENNRVEENNVYRQYYPRYYQFSTSLYGGCGGTHIVDVFNPGNWTIQRVGAYCVDFFRCGDYGVHTDEDPITSFKSPPQNGYKGPWGNEMPLVSTDFPTECSGEVTIGSTPWWDEIYVLNAPGGTVPTNNPPGDTYIGIDLGGAISASNLTDLAGYYYIARVDWRSDVFGEWFCVFCPGGYWSKWGQYGGNLYGLTYRSQGLTGPLVSSVVTPDLATSTITREYAIYNGGTTHLSSGVGGATSVTWPEDFGTYYAYFNGSTLSTTTDTPSWDVGTLPNMYMTVAKFTNTGSTNATYQYYGENGEDVPLETIYPFNLQPTSVGSPQKVSSYFDLDEFTISIKDYDVNLGHDILAVEPTGSYYRTYENPYSDRNDFNETYHQRGAYHTHLEKTGSDYTYYYGFHNNNIVRSTYSNGYPTNFNLKLCKVAYSGSTNEFYLEDLRPEPSGSDKEHGFYYTDQVFVERPSSSNNYMFYVRSPGDGFRFYESGVLYQKTVDSIDFDTIDENRSVDSYYVYYKDGNLTFTSGDPNAHNVREIINNGVLVDVFEWSSTRTAEQYGWQDISATCNNLPGPGDSLTLYGETCSEDYTDNTSAVGTVTYL